MYKEFLAFNQVIEKEREIEVSPYAETRMLSLIQQRRDSRVQGFVFIWKPALISLGVITAILAGISLGYQGQRLTGVHNQYDENLLEIRSELNASDVTEEDVINFD
jgi:hypothetical protein